MKSTTALGLFAVVALILATGALVVSLLVRNPLFRSGTYRTQAVAVLAIPVVCVAVGILLGVRDRRPETPYW